jgi:hypothetical protein
MHPVHDVDVLLLLATTLSSKRRPAELVEIMLAADLLQASIAFESKMGESFVRLSKNGLIVEEEGRFALTQDAQKIMSGKQKKADVAEQIFNIKEKLSAYTAQGEHTPINLSAEQIAAALAARQASGASGVKRVLVPKPKTDDTVDKRPGQWRKPFGGRKRRD